MKVSRFLSAALFVVAALAVPAAFAGISTPGSGGSSDLFLSLVNQTNGRSEVVDLGPVDAVLGRARRWTLDGGYQSRLGPGRLTYQFVAADLAAQGTNGFAGSVLYVSAGAASERLMTPRVWNSFVTVTAVSIADIYLLAAAPSFVARRGSLVFRSQGTPATNWGPMNARFGAPGRELGLGGFDASGDTGAALRFYRVVAGPKDYAGDTSGQVTLVGEFFLRGGALTFQPAVPPIP